MGNPTQQARLHRGESRVTKTNFAVAAIVMLGLILFFSQRTRADWQIQMRGSDGIWVPWITTKGHIAKPVSSQSACMLDLANAKLVMSEFQLECRYVPGGAK